VMSLNFALAQTEKHKLYSRYARYISY